MLSGGWYPVLGREGERITISVGGARYTVDESFLELSEEGHPNAVWSFGADQTGDNGITELKLTVVCPRGHHVAGVSPLKPRCGCERCGQEFEIGT
jgi:hypothetical protein